MSYLISQDGDKISTVLSFVHKVLEKFSNFSMGVVRKLDFKKLEIKKYQK